jgi:hypothetical protein
MPQDDEPTSCPVDSWARGVLVCASPTPHPKEQIPPQNPNTVHKSTPNLSSPETKQSPDSLTKSVPPKYVPLLLTKSFLTSSIRKSHSTSTQVADVNRNTKHTNNHSSSTVLSSTLNLTF